LQAQQKPAKAGFCISAPWICAWQLLKQKQGFTDQNALRIVRDINSGNAEDAAQMVKLVDTPASGAGDRKVVEVRVFFWAPIQASRS
jgi:hypothetical protein